MGRAGSISAVVGMKDCPVIQLNLLPIKVARLTGSRHLKAGAPANGCSCRLVDAIKRVGLCGRDNKGS